MAITIKNSGLEAYLNQYYGPQGGFGRLSQMIDMKWPIMQIAKEFGVDRRTAGKWVKQVKQGMGVEDGSQN